MKNNHSSKNDHSIENRHSTENENSQLEFILKSHGITFEFRNGPFRRWRRSSSDRSSINLKFKIRKICRIQSRSY